MRTAEARRGSTRTAIRIRPLPIVDPPYDDGPPAADALVPGQLALSWTAPAHAAAGQGRAATEQAVRLPHPAGGPRPDLPTIAGGPPGAGASVLADKARTRGDGRPVERPARSSTLTDDGYARALPPVVAGASAEARRSVHRFVAAFTEVLNGYRPASHLRQLAHPMDAAVIVAQARAAGDRIAQWRRAEPGTARAAARSAARHGRGFAPVAVLRLHLCEPRPGAVEATVLLVAGGRTWALPLRLECYQGTWAATVARLL